MPTSNTEQRLPSSTVADAGRKQRPQFPSLTSHLGPWIMVLDRSWHARGGPMFVAPGGPMLLPGDTSCDRGATIAHLCRPSVPRRQVPLFHASACDKLTPPLHRAPPRPHAGRSLAEGAPSRGAFVLGLTPCPSFDAITNPFDASAVLHTRSSSRRTPDPLVAGRSRSRFPPRLLTDMTLRRFGLSACTANPEGLPPSLGEHGSC